MLSRWNLGRGIQGRQLEPWPWCLGKAIGTLAAVSREAIGTSAAVSRKGNWNFGRGV
jgi:hypothetical protein